MKQRIQNMIASARTNAEEGAVMFLVAMTVLLVMLAGAIAVDLSALSTRGQSLQNAADSAALAGVQAYRASIGDATDATEADKDAARAAVTNLLRQNGITLDAVVLFPDETNHTEVQVILRDPDAGFLLSGFTGGKTGSVERGAVATFEACDSQCVKEVDIPPPFNGVNAQGDGDGYKPIPVGEAIYSINHQSGGGNGRGNLQITCVLRGPRDRTDDPSRQTQLCWDDGNGVPVPGQVAYPAGYRPLKTPEMPHAAVFESRIFWASSTTNGHYLYCFETATSSPCSTPFPLNNSTEGSQELNSYRNSHRGGATVEWGGNIFTFTDDHRVHCVVPDYPMRSCGSSLTSLGRAGFPPNLPSEGNHGSSMDRIVDEDSGRIYSTIHIVNTDGTFDPNEDPAPICQNDSVENLSEEQLRGLNGKLVTIKNISTLFLEVNSAGTGIIDGVDDTAPTAHWTVWAYDLNGEVGFAFESLTAGKYLTMSQERYPWGKELELQPNFYVPDGPIAGNPLHSIFEIQHDATTSLINTWEQYDRTFYDPATDTTTAPDLSDGSEQFEKAFLYEGILNPGPPVDFVLLGGDEQEATSDEWIIKEVACQTTEQEPTGELLYEPGTYLNCHNARTGGSCGGFSPLKLHNDSSSFSGRLFFHRNGAGTPTGVCSTGFTTRWIYTYGAGRNFSDETEVTCVDLYGRTSPSLEADMQDFRDLLSNFNDAEGHPTESDRYGRPVLWGTWGDPHYNAGANRLYYPTHRIDSAVLCWQWGAGTCSESAYRVGESAFGRIQDYGFVSEGDCVFGLGHKAIFWAFKASDIEKPCDTTTKSTTISPCQCGGELFWGTIEFDVTTDQFESFLIQIKDLQGNAIWPVQAEAGVEVPPHDLLVDGPIVNLSDVPVLSADQKLEVLVTVKSKEGINPWENGQGSQTFTIEIERTPRLTD